MSPRKSSRVRHFIEYAAILLLQKLCCGTQLHTRHRIAHWLGLLFYYVIPFRKKVIQQNLRRAFPEKSPGERQKIMRATYIHFAKVYLDLFPVYLDPPHRFNQYVVCKNPELIEQVFRQERGALAVLFHLGNWEAGSEWFVRQVDRKVAAIIKRQKNRRVDRLINYARSYYGGIVFKKRTAPLTLFRFLKQNNLLILIADQDARRSGIFVQFLNQWSSSYRGPALFALKQKCPVLLASCILNADEKYVVRLHHVNPREILPKGTDPVQTFTQYYTQYFEKIIRRYPEQYYWFHRRWKTKPAESAHTHHDQSNPL